MGSAVRKVLTGGLAMLGLLDEPEEKVEPPKPVETEPIIETDIKTLNSDASSKAPDTTSTGLGDVASVFGKKTTKTKKTFEDLLG